MIPERNKDLFIESIAQGKTFEEACSLSHISRPTAFRFLKDPEYKKRYDTSLFEVKEKKRLNDEKKGMEDLKKMIKRRKI